MAKTRVGVIGCGNICGIYFKNLKRFPFLEVAACADLLPDRAKAKAAEFGVPKVCTPKELLADRGISTVLNITIPKAHFEIAAAALEAGKGVYNEKPLAVRREDGEARRDGRAEETPPRLRAGHVPGRGPADLPQAD